MSEIRPNPSLEIPMQRDTVDVVTVTTRLGEIARRRQMGETVDPDEHVIAIGDHSLDTRLGFNIHAPTWPEEGATVTGTFVGPDGVCTEGILHLGPNGTQLTPLPAETKS